MLQAVIFDMDGVISDTQVLHSTVESRLLARFGILIAPEEITRRYAGVRTRDFFAGLLATQSLPYDLDDVLAEKRDAMLELARQWVQEIPWSVALIRRLANNNIPLAVASSSNAPYVMTVLDELQIADYFKVVVNGDMVQQGKPHPECFLLAANLLWVSPAQCVVIEDAINGMLAAQDAGMHCIGLVADPTLSYPTKHLVTTLAEITDGMLSTLMKS
jgi:HAD superfamily hydrolase (TIGR01509 family)